MILSPREGQSGNDLWECLKCWNETKNASEALEKLPYRAKNSLEALLLKGIKKHGKKDFLNALNFVSICLSISNPN